MGLTLSQLRHHANQPFAANSMPKSSVCAPFSALPDRECLVPKTVPMRYDARVPCKTQ